MVIMMSRWAVMAGIVAGAVVHISAQDPTKTLPDSYKVELENDHVRVVRVHYDAGAKLPDHTHPAGTTVYVYLNDSDGVVFRHSGRSNRAVTRPAVTAGSVRVASGPEEHHTAENPASTPSDFLRIWLKTDDAGAGRTMRRLPPSEQEYASKQLRITRIAVAPERVAWIETPPQQPALVITLRAGSPFQTLLSGNVRWIDAGQRVPLSVADLSVELLRIDFLTAPK
jgi:hypothetical protein